MAYWLMKSEPDELSINGLEKLGEARWDGVRNYQARNFLRAMAVGDEFSSTTPAAPSRALPVSAKSSRPPTRTRPRWNRKATTSTPRPVPRKLLERNQRGARRDVSKGTQPGLSETTNRPRRIAFGAKRQPVVGDAGDRRAMGGGTRPALTRQNPAVTLLAHASMCQAG